MAWTLWKRVGMVLCLGTFLVLFCSFAHGEESGKEEGEWTFSLTPYFWMTSIDGNLTVKGYKTPVDVGFGDIWSNLAFGGQIHVEARKGAWGLFVDPSYLNLSVDQDSPYGKIETEGKTWLVEFGGVYRVKDWSVGVEERHPMSLDVLAGGRYWGLTSEIKIPDGTRLKGSKGWIDPFVGVRFHAWFTERFSILLRADVGGFGVGSHFTWNALGVFGYQFTQMISGWIGYRALGVNYDDGEGANTFKYDVTNHGPILGLKFQF